MINSLTYGRPLAATLLTLAALPMLPAAQAAPAAELFFRPMALGAPILSPSGKKIAMLVPAAGGRVGLAVAEIDSPATFKGVAQFEDADVRSVRWVNNERMVFDLTDQQKGTGDQLGSGLYAVNADGSRFEWLIKRTWAYAGHAHTIQRALSSNYRFVRVAGDGSDDVIVVRYEWEGQGRPLKAEPMRLNTLTVATRRLYAGSMPKGAYRFILDPGLQPRAVIASDGKRESVVHWRDAGSAEWRELYRFNHAEELNATRPLAVDRDGTLYVSAVGSEVGADTLALFRYDVKERKVEGKPVVALPGFDFSGQALIDQDTRQMLGVSYEQEAEGVVWLDKTMRGSQAAVDKLLPHTNNIFICTHSCAEARHLVVSAASDIQSPVYFLFDRQISKLTLLGASRPWFKSTEMATQDFTRITTRDGLSMPVYVTKPKGKGPFPTVVMVHGGPYLRGVQWGFDPVAQFLASRGYMVVEPEFRGSLGYGSKLFKAGWKQWGLSMQDDVTDATQWAIAQGLADPRRIAIAGSSYGGYATMMGLLKEPELYKAGINIVGVTDIELMYTIGWSDFLDAGNPWVRYGMPNLIGDLKTDAAQLAATSPLKQAAKIKRPVLMAYGEEDLRVPLPHGTKMRDALRAAGNQDVEWVQYPLEGHGFNLTKNNVDLWTRAEAFLGKHLK
jgi:dipeptidyl aminopeptidase/acylaminoacyl peptidase